MKTRLILLFLLTSVHAFGQDYNTITAKAMQYYQNNEYEKSVTKYKEAFLINQQDPSDLYNAACSAALTGDSLLALEWLNLALKNGWMHIRHMKQDPDLTTLHHHEAWDTLLIEMQKKVDKIEANYNKPLQEKLLAVLADDQGIRQQYISAVKAFGYESNQVDSLTNLAILIDSVNLLIVMEILDHYGWVGPTEVGPQASQTLFLVIQHADLKTQQRYLPVMRTAVKNKKADASSLALLEDRVALREGKRQIYGSQIGRDETSQEHYVLPLEDPDNVDARRAEVGLEPLADYLKNWNISWDVEEYKKRLSKLDAAQQ